MGHAPRARRRGHFLGFEGRVLRAAAELTGLKFFSLLIAPITLLVAPFCKLALVLFQDMFSWLKCCCTQPANLSEEDLYKTPSSITPRKDASVAEWNDEAGTAIVKSRKGKLWNNTGVLRKGKLLCHVEEAVFLVENGYLVLEHNGAAMKLEQVFELLCVAGHGCTLEAYQVYSHLKALGYALARHGVSWSDKGNSSDPPALEENSQQDWRPMFDVYPPSSKFKKTEPPLPAFSICVCSAPPTRRDVKNLEQRSSVPVKFAAVHGKHVGIYSFSNVELQSLQKV